MTPKSPHSFFVYGTLKRGFLRESIWPHSPDQVEPAAVQGALFDLGPYPAIEAGSDFDRNEFVLGELWTFPTSQLPATLAALDEAEGFGQVGEPNYYERRTVEALTLDGRKVPAFAYVMDPGRLSKARRIPPSQAWNGLLCASWPDEYARVPLSLQEEELLEENP